MKIKVYEAHTADHQTTTWQDQVMCDDENCEKYDSPVAEVEQSNDFDMGEDYFREGQCE